MTKVTTQVTVVWGKSHFYSPVSNEPFIWDGSLQIEGGELRHIEQLNYRTAEFGPVLEDAKRLEEPRWRSNVRPGSPEGLEGIRFVVQSDPSAEILLHLAPQTIRFTVEALTESEHLRFHAGGKYSGSPIDVFLGPDARPRVSRRRFLECLEQQELIGWLIQPDDFAGVEKTNCFSTYGASIPPGGTARTAFPLSGSPSACSGQCPVRLQLMALRYPIHAGACHDRWMDFEVCIGRTSNAVRHLFTSFRSVQKIEDIYVNVPWQELSDTGNELAIRNPDPEFGLFVHRVYINAGPPSHLEALKALPPLTARPALRIGYDTNTLAPENDEMDDFLRRLEKEELGNYVLFRLERRAATADDLRRWAAIIAENGFAAANCVGASDECDRILRSEAPSCYLGIHSHEVSNLIYGWGTPEPLADRAGRTLPECRDAYLRRMSGREIVGQAIPLQHLDYAAGMKLVISEPPTGHSSLLLAGARGAARAFNKDLWGAHIANHVTRCPADDDMARRNFILLCQSWLYGARLIYDEESALYAFHDAPYAFSDPIPYERRRQYQWLYHFASAIELGEPEVNVAFLHGYCDCLVGGLQGSPGIPPTKVWGALGPETDGWGFDTPERGWELLSSFMPGVWLYPVEQDPRAIRQFFCGTPHGQVDLVPIDAAPSTLSAYGLLVLPGWNTMTEDAHASLLEYARSGGHLVLSAAQCTEHVSREFLLAKQDFRLFRDGDLRELAGVQVGAVKGMIDSIHWEDGQVCGCPGLPAVATTVDSAQVLAADQDGRPVLVENRVGQGKVWMLTAGEYWGHAALDELRAQMGARLTGLHAPEIHISGDTEDVDFHRFRDDHGCRVVLLNTDWTSAGNAKSVTLHTPVLDIPLQVIEGALTQIMIRDDVAVVFASPPALVSALTVDPNAISFQAGGTGQSQIRLFSRRGIACASESCSVHVINDNQVVFDIDFGPTWNTRGIEL